MSTPISVAYNPCLLQGHNSNLEFRVTKYTRTPENHNHIAVLNASVGAFEFRRLLERTTQTGERTVFFPAVRLPKNAETPWLPPIVITDRAVKRRFDEQMLAAIDSYLAKVGTQEASNA
ncbi:MAG: hypothetical protein ACR2JB_29580 [Bryobacteraceae bacterium]